MKERILFEFDERENSILSSSSIKEKERQGRSHDFIGGRAIWGNMNLSKKLFVEFLNREKFSKF